MESPYDTFRNVKKQYPPWFSESIVFMWDASGLLNGDTFKLSNQNGENIKTRIIEHVTAEYVDYLLKERFKNSLDLLSPYLMILDNASLARALRELIKFDFKADDHELFKAYEEKYKFFITSRQDVEIEKDYETLIDLRGRHFDGAKEKKDFYDGLKLLVKKKSIKSFNDRIIKKIDEVFNNEFSAEVMFEDSFNEYKEWKEVSGPFCLLATYCEILKDIENKYNERLNENLAGLYVTKTIECPLQYRILIIQEI